MDERTPSRPKWKPRTVDGKPVRGGERLDYGPFFLAVQREPGSERTRWVVVGRSGPRIVASGMAQTAEAAKKEAEGVLD